MTTSPDRASSPSVPPDDSLGGGSEEKYLARARQREFLKLDLARVERWGEQRHRAIYAGAMIGPQSLDDDPIATPNDTLHLFVVPSDTSEAALAELTRTLDNPDRLKTHRVERSSIQLQELLHTILRDVERGRWGRDVITAVSVDITKNAVALGIREENAESTERLQAAYEHVVFYEGRAGEEVSS